MATQLLEMWAIIACIDAVRDYVGAANVKFRARKHIRASANEILSVVLLIEGKIVGQATQQTLYVI